MARVILALFGQGPLFGAHIGGPSPSLPGVCLNAAQALLQRTGSGLGQAGLSPGVHATSNTANVCAAHPTGWQALAFTVTMLPIDLLRLGALYLADAAGPHRRPRRHLHCPGRPAAADPRLVAAGRRPGRHPGRAFARLNLLGQLVTWNVDWGQWPVAWSVSWPVVWIGLGLIIFARVMRIGAGMRADLEGTV